MRSHTRERLEELLRHPIEDESDADRARQAADLLRQFLALTREAEALLADQAPPEPQGSLAGLTLHDAAERVLEEAGAPLHARDLGARIKAGGWSHPRSRVARPEQIVHQLAARLPKKPQFRRVAPQTFALAKWGDGVSTSMERTSLGLFKGPGEAIGRRAGSSQEPVEDAEWRSS